jgi:hypothetical protein
MKTLKFVIVLAAVSAVSVAYAQKGTQVFPKPSPTAPPPPRDVVVEPPPERLPTPPPKPTVQLPQQGPQVYTFAERPMGGRSLVLTPEQAQTIITRFKTAYDKLEKPRLLICVTRDLAAPVAGGADDPQALPDVERLFGKPLEAAGATLADPRAATPLLAAKPLEAYIGGADTPQARKDREAMARITDVVIEVLITSKTVAASGGTEGQGITIPDIQSRAVRLSDSKIIGAASSTLLTNRMAPAKVADYDVRELAEAAALALMEQM